MDIARNFYKKAASSSGLRRFSWNRKKPRTLKFRIKFMLAVFVECTSISNQEFLPKDKTNVWLKPDWVELTSVRYWSSLILASWTSCRCKLRVSKNHNSYQISKKKKRLRNRKAQCGRAFHSLVIYTAGQKFETTYLL